MNEYHAKQALRELGIKPTPELIRNWLRAEEAAAKLEAEESVELATQPVPKPRSDGRKRGSSRSTLAHILRQQRDLVKKIRPGQKGRPRIIAEWFPEVAASMAAGLSLPEALKKHGITLDDGALRALYRNRAFKEVREQARQKYLKELRGAGYEICDVAAGKV